MSEMKTSAVKQNSRNKSQPRPFLQRKGKPGQPEETPFISRKHSEGMQPKLKIGESNDKYEQEAERVTEQIMRMPEPKEKNTSQGPYRNAAQDAKATDANPPISIANVTKFGDQRRKLFQVGYQLNQFRNGVRDLSRTAKALGDKNPLTRVEIRRLNRIYQIMPAWGKKNINELADLIEQRQSFISDEDSAFVQLTSEKVVLGMRNETILAAGAMLKINDQFHKFVRLDDSAVDTAREIAGIEILDLKGFSKAKKMGKGMISQAQFESFGKFVDAMQEASSSDEMIKRLEAENKAYKIQEKKRKAAINDALLNGPKRKMAVPYATARIIGKSFGVADIKPEQMEDLLRGNVKGFLKTIARNELGVKGKEKEALEWMTTLFSLNNQVAVGERKKEDVPSKNWGYINFMMAEAQLQSQEDRDPTKEGIYTPHKGNRFKTSKRHRDLLILFGELQYRKEISRYDFENLMDVAMGKDEKMSNMREFFLEKAIDEVAGKIIMITIEIEMVLLGGAALRAAKAGHGAVRALATVSEVSGLAVAANELPEQVSSIFGNSYDAKTGLEHAGVSKENSKRFTAIASIISLGTGGVGGILKWRHTRNLEKAGRLVKALEADSVEVAEALVNATSKQELVAIGANFEKEIAKLSTSGDLGRKGTQVLNHATTAKGVGSNLDETIDNAVGQSKLGQEELAVSKRPPANDQVPIANDQVPTTPPQTQTKQLKLTPEGTPASPNYPANQNAEIGRKPPNKPEARDLQEQQELPVAAAAGGGGVKSQVISSSEPPPGSLRPTAMAGEGKGTTASTRSGPQLPDASQSVLGQAVPNAPKIIPRPPSVTVRKIPPGGEKGFVPISPRKKLAEETPKLRKPRTPDEEFADFEKWRTAELSAPGPMTSDELLQMYRHGSRATVAKYLRRYLQKQAAQSGLMTVGNMSRKVKPGVPLNEQVHEFVKSLEGAHFTPQSFSKKLPKEIQGVLPGGKFNAADTLVTLTDKRTHTAMDKPWKDAFRTMRASGTKKATGQKVFDEVADGIRKTPGMSDSEIASRIARLEDEMFTELGILRSGIEYPIPRIYNWWEILAFKAGKK